jgi:hypothetical protein
MVERRKKLSREELTEIAIVVVQAMKADEDCTVDKHCNLNDKEVQSIREILQHKKKASLAALWVIGALAYWVLKDVYEFVSQYFSYAGPPPH